MSEYIGDDEAHSCPYMFLWNPVDVGRLGAYTSIALVNEEITEYRDKSLPENLVIMKLLRRQMEEQK